MFNLTLERLLIAVAVIAIIGLLVAFYLPSATPKKQSTSPNQIASQIVQKVVFTQANSSFTIPNIVLDNTPLEVSTVGGLTIEFYAADVSIPYILSQGIRLHYFETDFTALNIIKESPVKEFNEIPIAVRSTGEANATGEEELLDYVSDGTKLSLIPVIQVYYSNSTTEDGRYIYYVTLIIPEFSHIKYGGKYYERKTLSGMYNLVFNVYPDLATALPAENTWVGNETRVVMKVTLFDQGGSEILNRNITLFSIDTGDVVVLTVYKVYIEVVPIFISS